MLHFDPLAVDPAPDGGPVLFDFTTAGREGSWTPVDDRSVGGESTSALAIEPRVGSFHGDLAPSACGFVSVRATPERPLDLSGAGAIELLARGDGRTYQLRLGDGRDGLAWAAAFRPDPGFWRLVQVPLDDLEPMRRGRLATGEAPLDRRAVASVALLLADGEPGSYRLDLRWIRAVR